MAIVPRIVVDQSCPISHSCYLIPIIPPRHDSSVVIRILPQPKVGLPEVVKNLSKYWKVKLKKLNYFIIIFSTKINSNHNTHLPFWSYVANTTLGLEYAFEVTHVQWTTNNKMMNSAAMRTMIRRFPPIEFSSLFCSCGILRTFPACQKSLLKIYY